MLIVCFYCLLLALHVVVHVFVLIMIYWNLFLQNHMWLNWRSFLMGFVEQLVGKLIIFVWGLHMWWFLWQWLIWEVLKNAKILMFMRTATISFCFFLNIVIKKKCKWKQILEGSWQDSPAFYLWLSNHLQRLSPPNILTALAVKVDPKFLVFH